MRPLIGITCGTSALDPHARAEQDRLNLAYSIAVSRAGAIPVVLPTVRPGDDPNELLDRIDGLLLSGGYDCDPCLYGEARLNETVEVDLRRDEWELPLIRAAVKRGAPTMAICRGIQSLNVALGGTLYQDLHAQNAAGIEHRQTQGRDVTTHSIEIDSDSRLLAIVGGTRLEVNSFHHQALRRVAHGLRVVARAPDGVIEAVEGEGDAFLVAVQFHPEELVFRSPQAQQLFNALADSAKPRT
jgi:putative glutamine amidotransferase